MNLTTLDILRCPFCGCRPTCANAPDDATIRYATLVCECSEYPLIDGIPFFQQDYSGAEALEHLAQGAPEAALTTLLGLDEPDDLRAFLADENATYRDGLALLAPDDEGPYFLSRLADPTFLAAETVVRAVGGEMAAPAQRAIDICGGSGHLTRVLRQMPFGEVWLADTDFWKLWLARRFIAPAARMICCDANNPLPFAPESFALAVCSDAFHYVWSKRLLAEEMARLTGEDGAVLLTHAHNSRRDNYSAGMPLTPAAYRNLWPARETRVFGDSALLDSVCAGQGPDLTAINSDEELDGESSLTLLATNRAELFQAYAPPAPPANNGVWRLNPLYEATAEGAQVHLRLSFPSPEYAAEYAACRRYLPESLTVSAAALSAGAADLIAQRVLLEMPERYL